MVVTKHSSPISVVLDGSCAPRAFRKHVAVSNQRYASWSTALNEAWASALGAALEINVVPVAVVAADTIETPYCGSSLFDLEIAGVRAHQLRPGNALRFADILVFSHAIGDADRSVHHVLVDAVGDLWSIDYQFCGVRPVPDRYPEAVHDIADPVHFSLPHALAMERPISERCRPSTRLGPDVYPWNASALLYALRTQIVSRDDLHLLRLSADRIASCDRRMVLETTASVFGDTDLCRRMERFVGERIAQLPRALDTITAYLFDAYPELIA